MVEKRDSRRGLGRGLSALMADVGPAQLDTTDAPARTADRSVPIEQIVPNPDQPRRAFASQNLEELADSIRSKGVIQPLIVRPKPGNPELFEIVAGERRWRAAQMAQLHELPVVIREFSDTETLEVAIIENIQRADLNPIEEAAGFRQLMDRFGHTQEKLAEALGKSRSHIANLLRLLSLPDEVRKLVQDGALSAGHARALITSEDPAGLARQVVSRGLSVRETEKLAKGQTEPSGGGAKSGSRQSSAKDPDTIALEGDLSAAIGMKAVIQHSTNGESGQLILHYRDLVQLDDLCRRLTGDH